MVYTVVVKKDILTRSKDWVLTKAYDRDIIKAEAEMTATQIGYRIYEIEVYSISTQ